MDTGKALLILTITCIAISLIIPNWIKGFAGEEGKAFLENPNFSPANIQIYDHALIVSTISNLIHNGVSINLLGWVPFVSASLILVINPFSLFGALPNNFIQTFLAENVSSLAFVPATIAMPLLVIMGIAIFGILLGILSSVVKLVSQ